MKITVTGSLGNISRPLTQELVQKGHTVTVISSKPEKQKEIEALGAIAAIGSIKDVRFLTDTFTGSDAVYTMVPPTYFLDPDADVMEYYRSTANNYVQAIQDSGVKRLVHLSSIGAHMEVGSGLVLGHHKAEQILGSLSGVSITFMRPAAFYYNLFGFIGVIKASGNMAANYGETDRIIWVSPKDIAAAIADEFVTPLDGKKVRYVASDELTCNEVAGILGAAIGKPDMKWIIIPKDEMQRGLESRGMPKRVAAGMAEMNASMHSGTFFDDYYLHKPPVTGKVKMKDFAHDFAAIFNQK